MSAKGRSRARIGSEARSAEDRPVRTQDDTLGPYYPPALVANGTLDLVRGYPGMTPRARGTPIEFIVRLLDVDGAPATGALLETWQANTDGVYRVPGSEARLADDPYFEGFGRVYAADGRFAITTVMPGGERTSAKGRSRARVGPEAHSAEGSPESATTRAPCITLTLFSDGIARLVTQVFFAGDPRNETDPVLAGLPPALRERLVAQRVAEHVYAIDVHMRGERETPFFDDR